MLYLMTHSAHFLFTVIWCQTYGKGPLSWGERKGVFYLKTHSTHFIYGYMASDIW